jgi:hypothetical protein
MCPDPRRDSDHS